MGRVTAYAVLCIDKPDGTSEAKRKQHALAHLAYVETILDRILVAGPLKAPDGPTQGSLLVFAVETEAEAKALLEGDPYFAADIWQSVAVYPYWGVAGQWVGGKTW
jgi:uncharacterized protein YciI